MLKNQLAEYFAIHRQDMIDDISALIAIQSDRQDPLPGKPYGEGPAACLDKALAIASRMGFATKNYDYYVGAVDFSDAETELDILAHLDVVPVGDGWTVTEPFTPKLVGTKLYGRGSNDDKGPAVAALYAMKALKDLGVELKKNVRLIVGCDEECGSSDIAHYYAIEKEAPCTFSPDAEFPVINTEKGAFQGRYSASFAEDKALPRIVSVDAGTKINIVPDKCISVIEGMTAAELASYLEEAAAATGAAFTAAEKDGLVEITCKGYSAHASTPDRGNNAITASLTLLSMLPIADSEGYRALLAMDRLFPHGDWYGEAAGIAMCDEISGKLTNTLDIFHYTLTSLEGATDCRASLCATDENLTNVIRKNTEDLGLTLDPACALREPHHVPAESPFVQTLLKVYEQYTGKKGEPIAIGGGTYAHHLKNGVAFGCTFPWSEDNHMHGDNEFVEMDELLLCAQMFAQVIADICG